MMRVRSVAPAAALGLALVVAVVLSVLPAGCGMVSAAQPSGSAPHVTLAGILSGRFTTRVPEPAFLCFPTDDNSHSVYEIGTLKVHRPKVLPVYLMGGSNVREAVLSPAAMQAALKQATGVTTKVVTFAAPFQKIAADLALIDNLPRGPGVVVISVNPADFAWGDRAADAEDKGVPLLLKSAALDALLRREGHTPAGTVALGYERYLESYRKHNAAALQAGTRPWNVYKLHECNLRAESRPVQERILERWLRGAGKPGGAFDIYHAFWLRALTAAADLAHARGYVVVISEASYNTTLVGARFDSYHKAYVPACRRIARKGGGRYVDPNASAQLTAGDFRDLYHVLATGRPKWTSALARLLAPAVLRAAKG